MGLTLVSDTTTPTAVPNTPEVRKIAYILRGNGFDGDRIRKINRSKTYLAAGLRNSAGKAAFDALVDAGVILQQDTPRQGTVGTYYLTDRLWQVPELDDLEMGEIIRWYLRGPVRTRRELELTDPVFGEERKKWVLEAFIGGNLVPREGLEVPW